MTRSNKAARTDKEVYHTFKNYKLKMLWFFWLLITRAQEDNF